jgi:hypothetical protein
MGEWVAFLHALLSPLSQLGDAIRTGSTQGALFEDMSGDNIPAKRMTAALAWNVCSCLIGEREANA